MQARQFVIFEQNAESKFSFSGTIDEYTTPPGFKTLLTGGGGGSGSTIKHLQEPTWVEMMIRRKTIRPRLRHCPHHRCLRPASASANYATSNLGNPGRLFLHVKLPQKQLHCKARAF